MPFDHYLFKPHFLFRDEIFQTIIGSQFFGNTDLPFRKIHKIKIEKQSQLMVLELAPDNPDATVVLLAHGMGGCSESAYMKRIARKLWIRGMKVFMMNHRGSGLGIGLSERLWNGGVSDDLGIVIDYISKLYPKRPIDVVGFSLSGNILLKYLGEKRRKPLKIRKGCAINPPIDLKISSHLLSKTKKGAFFNRYFMKLLHRQGEALAECFPDMRRPSGKEKTILEFDQGYTAPAAGYQDADDYYEKCSAKKFLDSITTPTTIIYSEDDPFIQAEIFKSVRLSSSIKIYTPEHGGHMGYISNKPTPWGDHRWMDFMVADWAGDLRSTEYSF